MALFIWGGNAVYAQNTTPFVTTWEVAAGSLGLTIPIPTSGNFTYSYTVDWGDSSATTTHTGDATHTYTTPGVYTVSISGTFPSFYFCDSKMKTIKQWGDNPWKSMGGAFQNCRNLTIESTAGNPNLSNVTNMYGMFFGATAFNNQDISGWDVSNVTHMNFMFYGTAFNQDISGWDVSNVTNMHSMFRETTAFNQDISRWNVSKVTDMSYMFYLASAFNQALIEWDVNSVTTMHQMFNSADAFNQDLSGWDVSNVTDMSYMFIHSSLSTENYDALLRGWSALPLHSSVDFGGGNSRYCDESARNILVNTYNWRITDAGSDDCRRYQAPFTFASPRPTKNFGDAAFTVTPTGGSGDGGITYLSSDTSVATIDTNTGEVTIVGVGKTTITATKAGNTTYNPATARYVLLIAKAEQAAFDFASTTVDKTLVDPTFTQPAPTGGSGTGAITWESSDPAVASVSATTGEVTIKATGTTTITATKAADTNYNEATASYTLTVTKAEQEAFDFASTTVDKTFGDTPFTHPAPTGGSSTGAITYESSGLTVATVAATSGEVTIITAGTTTITATKAADTNYNEATASYTLTVAKAEQPTFAFDNAIVDKVFGEVFTIVPTDGSGTGAITYESSGLTIATVAATSGEVTIAGTGTTTITATKAADTNYNEATATYTLTVAKAEQPTFAFDNAIVDKVFGEVFTIVPTDGSGTGAITWESNAPTVATVATTSGEVTIKATGTATITATKAADANYNGATARYTLNITKAEQEAFDFASTTVDKTFGDTTFTQPAPTGGTGIGAITYESSDSAVASVSVTSGEVTIITAGTTTITATKAGNTNYNAATASYTLTVAKAEQATFTFANITVDKSFGDPVFTFTPTGGSGTGGITYQSTDPSVAIIDINTGEVTIAGIGTIIIIATKATDTNYNEATTLYLLTIDNTTAFVTTWEVTADSLGITIPTNRDFTYRYTVDWGDNSADTRIYTGDATHTYPTADSYTVSIAGTFPSIYFNNSVSTNSRKIKTIKQWGDNPWKSMNSAFRGCENLTIEAAAGNPDLSNVTDMSWMFYQATTFNQDIDEWDVSKVTDMSYMFANADIFNQDLSRWDVSKVTDMSFMFYRVTLSTANYDALLRGWSALPLQRDVSFGGGDSKYCARSARTTFANNYNWSITDGGEDTDVDCTKALQSVFAFASATLTKSIRDRAFTIRPTGGSGAGAITYTSGDLNVATVSTSGEVTIAGIGTTTITATKAGNTTYNPATASYTLTIDDIAAFVTTWEVTADSLDIIIPTYWRFTYGYTVDWGDSSADTSIYTGDATHTYTTAGIYTVSIAGTFPSIYFGVDPRDSNNRKIKTIKQWGDNPWKSMGGAFQNCRNLTIEATAGNPNLSKVTDMGGMFNNATAFNQDISGWDVSKVTDMGGMFNNATAFNQDISGWDVSKVTTMRWMFYDATAFNQDISGWDVSKVTTMRWMFYDAGLSTENYDALLIGWSALPLQRDVRFDVGTSKYCSESARNILVNTYNWRIADRGKDLDENCTGYQALFTFASPSLTRSFGDAAFTFTATGGSGTGGITYLSTDPSVAIIDVNTGEVTITGIGTTTITATKAGDTSYNPATARYTLTIDNSNAFVTTWEVTAGSLGITIPTNSDFTYRYTVNWGDSSADISIYTGDATHTYPTAGSYTVSIAGTFPSIYFNASSLGSSLKIKTIKQWGDNPWKSMNSAFQGCTNLTIEAAAGNPDLSSVTDMSRMFLGAAAFNQNINRWDVSKVTDMNQMFFGATAFNQDINRWDVSKVTDMNQMFFGATAFNQDINRWDVSKVTDMNQMFSGVTLSIENYDALLIGWSALPLQRGVSFGGGNNKYCAAESVRDVLVTTYNWHITDGGKDPEVECLIEQAVFAFASPSITKGIGDAAFTIPPTGGAGAGGITYRSTNPTVATIAANTGEVTIIGIGTTTITATKAGDTTYNRATARYTLTIDYANAFVTTWEVTAGSLGITIPTNSDFTYRYAVNWGDGSVDTRIYTGDATHTYPAAGSYTVSIVGTFPSIYFNSIGGSTNSRKIKTIKQWGDNPWKSMNRAFFGCLNLTIEATAGNPDLSKVTDMTGMFADARAFNQDLSRWDVSKVTDMNNMFANAYAFNQDLSRWDVSKVTDMSSMFFNADVFNQDLSRWDVSKVTDMSSMFFNADVFNQDLSRWDVSKVTDMSNMFNHATLSTANYDALLIGWSALSLQRDVIFNGGNSKYCAESARNRLLDTYNWSISDSGEDTDLDCTKAYQEVFAFASPRLTRSFGDAAFTFTPTGGTGTGGITYLSTDPTVATIDTNTGEVTIVDIGTTTITATKAGDTTYHRATARYSLTIDYGNTFVTTWGVAAGSLGITIPTNSDFAYSYTVDWGDSSVDTRVYTGDATHTYTTAGIYTVSISGTFPSIYFNTYSSTKSRKIKTIKQWGNNPWKSMNRAFSGCINLTIEATAGNPDLSNVTDMSFMFRYADSFNQNINGWDVSNVTNMYGMFAFTDAF